jgi:hypothetical protein
VLRASAAAVPLLAMLTGLHYAGTRPAANPDNYDAWQAFLTLHDMEQPRGLLDRLNIFFDNRDILATLPQARTQHRFPGASIPATDAPPERQPDIMMVLEESTFDPMLIARCPLALCDSTLLHPPRGASASEQGALLVHSTGGGTWLSEFAFLAGFDWRVFGRGGAYAPVSVAATAARAGAAAARGRLPHAGHLPHGRELPQCALGLRQLWFRGISRRRGPALQRQLALGA